MLVGCFDHSAFSPRVRGFEPTYRAVTASHIWGENVPALCHSRRGEWNHKMCSHLDQGCNARLVYLSRGNNTYTLRKNNTITPWNFLILGVNTAKTVEYLQKQIRQAWKTGDILYITTEKAQPSGVARSKRKTNTEACYLRRLWINYVNLSSGVEVE